MLAELEAGIMSQFPEVIWVDASERTRTDGINLIFGTRVEGQGTGLRIALTRIQWENLKFLVDGARM